MPLAPLTSTFFSASLLASSSAFISSIVPWKMWPKARTPLLLKETCCFATDTITLTLPSDHTDDLEISAFIIVLSFCYELLIQFLYFLSLFPLFFFNLFDIFFWQFLLMGQSLLLWHFFLISWFPNFSRFIWVFFFFTIIFYNRTLNSCQFSFFFLFW